jgi:Domain of unknown function (DUF4129)
VLSRPEAGGRARWAAVLLGVFMSPGEQALAQVAPGPSPAQIAAAVETVSADPNIATTRKRPVLRWVKSAAEERPAPDLGWVRWLQGLFAWLATASRAIVWVAAAVLVAVLAIFLLRLARARGLPRGAAAFVAPSHVQDLDIRPESLPDDIGAAARDLWDAGRQRGALSLLYRGLLSRLAHVHAVPIRDSSTEGDCLRLAEQRLSGERGAYVARLVRIWQTAVYGQTDPGTPVVHDLCSAFHGALDRA